MITPAFTSLWMHAKWCSSRLRHQSVTAAHLLYAFLRLDERRVHRAWKDCHVRAFDVHAFLNENPAQESGARKIHDTAVAPSAQAVLDRATELAGPLVGEKALVAALKEETGALVALILAHRSSPKTPSPSASPAP